MCNILIMIVIIQKWLRYFSKNSKCQDGSSRKVRGSPNSLGFIIWEPGLFVQLFLANPSSSLLNKGQFRSVAPDSFMTDYFSLNQNDYLMVELDENTRDNQNQWVSFSGDHES